MLLVSGTVALTALAGCGGGSNSSSTTSTTAPAKTPAKTASGGTGTAALVASGKALAASNGCSGCHSIDGSSGTGPTWRGLAGSQVKLSDGKTVTADDTYLTTSIEDPDAQIVKGFQPGIMSASIQKGSISPAKAKALVTYIKSLK